MKKSIFILIIVILFCFGVKANENNEFSSTLNSTEVIENVKFKRGVEQFLSSLKLNVNVDLNELVDTIVTESKSFAKIVFNSSSVTDITPAEGGRWVSIMADNQVISAYYHPTKRHYARAVGKTDPGRSYADPGEWAVAVVVKNTFGGNKAYYNVDCDCSDSKSCDCAKNDSNNEPEQNNVQEQNNEPEQNNKQEQNNEQVQNKEQEQNKNISDVDTSGIENFKYITFQNIFIMLMSIMIWQMVIY